MSGLCANKEVLSKAANETNILVEFVKSTPLHPEATSTNFLYVFCHTLKLAQAQGLYFHHFNTFEKDQQQSICLRIRER